MCAGVHAAVGRGTQTGIRDHTAKPGFLTVSRQTEEETELYKDARI